MKLSKTLLASAVALFASAASALAADTIVNIVGSTAFRAATHNTILNVLGTGTVYGYNNASASQGNFESAGRAIFIKVNGADRTIVRTAWSGSVEGIELLTTGANGTFISITGAQASLTTGGAALGSSPATESSTAQITFSDVEQASTLFTSPALEGGKVGVIPFLFVASESAPAGITNITDQQFIQLFQTGIVPASYMTGVAADSDKIVVATGRNSLSGTRTTAFAETGLGIFSKVQQYKATVTSGTIETGTLELFTVGEDLGSPTPLEGNGGYSSGGTLRTLLGAVSDDTSVSFIGYLGVSDANNAIAAGGRGLSYNGVPYSVEAVKNGSYTFWGYQQLYRLSSLSGASLTFFNQLSAAVPNNLGSAGIKESDLQVTRFGDGGPVQSNF